MYRALAFCAGSMTVSVAFIESGVIAFYEQIELKEAIVNYCFSSGIILYV